MFSIGKQDTYYWVGAHQEPNAKSPFQYINGESFNNRLWHTGEPNQINGRDRQCVTLGVTAQDLDMNDYPCSSSLNYMCEKSKFKITSCTLSST